ncbi:hypothetical protein BCR44DRAFT_59251 [Catenaria anguillulae PL171]|uniref:Uncharacterized protein n=1 Tax=Catenaria anguillulae PL171 TaxID=765915 RepID=A0A1Y2H5Y7_9FUNG|nr:hypothetical protein BCR44DRAFT_59251 [Catenaria anguillulae PL171]
MSLILQKLESLEKQVQELKEENVKLANQVCELKDENAKLANQVRELKKENVKLANRVEELESHNRGMYRVMDMRAQQELEIRQTGH